MVLARAGAETTPGGRSHEIGWEGQVEDQKTTIIKNLYKPKPIRNPDLKTFRSPSHTLPISRSSDHFFLLPLLLLYYSHHNGRLFEVLWSSCIPSCKDFSTEGMPRIQGHILKRSQQLLMFTSSYELPVRSLTTLRPLCFKETPNRPQASVPVTIPEDLTIGPAQPRHQGQK